jgi:hypothetical protein
MKKILLLLLITQSQFIIAGDGIGSGGGLKERFFTIHKAVLNTAEDNFFNRETHIHQAIKNYQMGKTIKFSTYKKYLLNKKSHSRVKYAH